MTLRYVLDEHLRGPLWRALQWHNSSGVYPVDVVRVGDPADLPLGTHDPAFLLWAEREQRILVTQDTDSMPAHLADHLAAGRHSPGVFMIRPRRPCPKSSLSFEMPLTPASGWNGRTGFSSFREQSRRGSV